MLDQDAVPMGHNNPPDPIESVIAEYDAVISEATNWADGEPVENEAAMKAVDRVLKEFKTYKTALAKAAKERTAPLHEAWKNEVAAVKVYTDDADRLQKCLVDSVGPFKKKMAAEKAAAERAEWERTEKLRREAEAKAAEAAVGNIEAQREADAAKQAAIDAEKKAKMAKAEQPKGMRTVHLYKIEDHRAALHDIAKNDRDALTAFIEEYVRHNHRKRKIDGVNTWRDREAF